MDSVTVKIRRSEQIEENSDIAIVKLNDIMHSKGTPIMINYYRGDKVETLTAIGIKNGKGKDCYSVVSISSDEIVNGVYEELPDVVQVVHGEVFIAKYNDRWCRITISDDSGTKYTELLDPEEKLSFFDLNEKIRWFWNGVSVYREYDFFTKDEVKGLLKDAPTYMKVTSSVEQGSLKEEGRTIVNPKINIDIRDLEGNKESLFRFDVKVTTLEGEENIIEEDIDYVVLERSITRSTQYIIKLIDTTTDIELTSYCKVDFVSPVYYGVYDSESEISPVEEGATKKILWDGESNLTLDITDPSGKIEDKKVVILIPTYLYKKPLQILDRNGLDYIEDYKVVSAEFDEKTYKELVKLDKFSMDNSFKQILIYE